VKQHALAVVLACCVLSFVACVALTPFAPAAAFYLLPTRAWELLAGASLAIAKKQYPQYSVERQSSFALPIGLTFVLLSFILVPDEGFPGWIAALPVMGSTLMLAGVDTLRRGVVHRFLAHRAMVFVGKRSYSLYLWHWPTFSFVDYYFYLGNSTLRLSLKVLITILGTLLTYHFVERPMRLWLNIPRHSAKAFGAFTLAATLLVVAGYTIRSTYYLSAEPRSVGTGGIFVNSEGRGWIVLIGDSQGAMYGYEFASLARTLDFRLNVLSVAAGNELPGEPETLWPSVLRFLEDRKPDAIILAQAWSSKLGEDGEEHFGNAMSALVTRASQIFVLTQPPVPPPDATRQSIRAGARPPFFENPVAVQSRLRANAKIRKFENDRIKVIDMAQYFLEPDNSIKMIAPNGRQRFRMRAISPTRGLPLFGRSSINSCGVC
jgi:hypothetical protein